MASVVNGTRIIRIHFVKTRIGTDFYGLWMVCFFADSFLVKKTNKSQNKNEESP